MPALLQTIIVLIFTTCFAQQEEYFVTERLKSGFIPGGPGVCPSNEALNDLLIHTREGLSSILDDVVLPTFEAQAVCPCGGLGKWRRIAQLDMRDPNQQCPSTWMLKNLVFSPDKRGCGRFDTNVNGCDSVVFPTNDISYSRVCGRVIAYMLGTPSAFYPSFSGRGLEDVYNEGIFITHGPAGSRRHIWSFAAALDDDPQTTYGSQYSCPCSYSNIAWTNTVPAFIQNNYFCDSADHGPGASHDYPDDPLWDGVGCSDGSSCCEFNNPPWFCTTLDQATSDDIEMRICMDEATNNEDTLIELIDLYVM